MQQAGELAIERAVSVGQHPAFPKRNSLTKASCRHVQKSRPEAIKQPLPLLKHRRIHANAFAAAQTNTSVHPNFRSRHVWPGGCDCQTDVSDAKQRQRSPCAC